MAINWFFYNFSNSVAGVHNPVSASVASALGETTNTVHTIAQLTPQRITNNDITTYLWLPIIGGSGYQGCYLYIELFVEGNWIKNDNSVIELDKIKNLKNMGIPMSTVKDKLFLLQEWDNFGICPSRINLYIPAGKSVSNFFVGLKKVDY
jgi:hypothetical protein